jgi:tRNA dimethylallyltransferase
MPAAARRGSQPAPLAAIVGPTASGKTDLALAIARRLDVEILAADSRQVYRGMDIGTAKPTRAARAAVPHHLLDLVALDEPFTVAAWVDRARACIVESWGRGRLPLVVGGTGLYLTALVDGYGFDPHASSPEVRVRLAAELQSDGLDTLAARLEALDPATAAATDLRNPRRVVRALERVEAARYTGTNPARPPADPYPGRLAMLGIRRPRVVLYGRIDARARSLFDGGLVDEVRSLLEAGYPRELAPLSGHGYREAAAFLAGEWSLEEAIAVTARRTRQYAKRQLSWFGRDRRIVWLDAGDRPADDPRFVDDALTRLRALLA